MYLYYTTYRHFLLLDVYEFFTRCRQLEPLFFGFLVRVRVWTRTILGMLKRTFESRDPGLWKDLYVSLVRPYLEYAVQAWNPHLQGDFDKFKRIQRRTARIPNGFEKFEY